MSEFPHVIVNQARVQDYLLDVMRRSAQRLEPDYDLEVVDVQRDNEGEYPVRVTLRRTDAARLDEKVVVRARYVVGCDGARSRVRTAIGQTLRGDAANHAWGVMDALAVTDFPDIRLKAAIQSASKGNLLIIPREGGYLARFYVDLGEVTPENRDTIKQITVERITQTAQRILHPYSLDVKEVAWFSVYEVGQRLTDRFDDAIAADGTSREPRVFIAGDACHTHSAKAGQGMNVSMQDGFNLGWKLGAVLQGLSDIELLRTYSDERQPIAQELIDFDKEWSAMMAAPPKDPRSPRGRRRRSNGTAGLFRSCGSIYGGRRDAISAGRVDGRIDISIARERLHHRHALSFVARSSSRRREADHLGHAARADGRWRLYAFSDASGSALNALCEHLAKSPDSVLRLITPENADADSVFDLRAVLQQPHREVRLEDLHALLLPRKGRYGLIDYEKAFTATQRLISSTSVASTGNGARSSWSVQTSTSRMYFRWKPTPN